MTTDKRTPARNTAANVLWENVKQIGLAVILALFIKTSVVEAYKIPTASMEDTLLIGDFLLANKFVYGARLPLVDWRLPAISEPERGDVVIFLFPGDGITKYIKRCVAVPGDTVLVKNKALFVNGDRFPDSAYAKYVDTTRTGQQNVHRRRAGGQDSRDFFGPYIVPPNCYFMMGDNRDNSYDSRYWQAVPKDLILGEAIMVHWSWNESEYPSPQVTVDDPLSVPRLFAYNVVHFVQKVRWDRLFNLIS
ncbi:MAG: signal peptidase I [Candidatus Zixiibacteriota bacterium]